MAVDYTKVFTVIGKYVDKVIDYNTYISTYTSDQTAIESTLSSQSLVRLGDGLTDLYDNFKTQIVSNIQGLVGRITDILTDETLIGSNFPFGTVPSLDIVFPALIDDMVDNDKNVPANTITVGSTSYDMNNTNPGVILIGTKLDAVTPPVYGGLAIKDYYNVTTQLAPTSESITLTCDSDSLPNNEVGQETFIVTGTGSASEGYDVSGENAGILGSITVVDNNTSRYLSNANLDTWTDPAAMPSSWESEEGTVGVDFFRSAEAFRGSGYSILGGATGETVRLKQEVPTTSFELGKAYFAGVWAKKDTDVASDTTVHVAVTTTGGTAFIYGTPTTTEWEFFYGQFLVPVDEESDTIGFYVGTTNDNGADPVIIDQVIVAPCEYFMGIALGMVTGPDRFIVGDNVTFTVSNDDSGKFQTFFRKAYKIQLPTDATPTISDSLVT